MDSELRSLRGSLSSLREELVDLQDTHSSLTRSTTQTIASQKAHISTLTRKSAILEDELTQFKQIADERSRTIEEIQRQIDELSASQDNSIRQGAEDESMEIIREELHRQAIYHRTLESTNAKLTAELTMLRERNTSVEVLKEEKRSLEQKLKAMEELRGRVVKLEAQLEAGRQEREVWYVCFEFILCW